MRVVFSKIANIHFNEILNELSEKWTEKQTRVFISEYEKVIENVKIKLVTYPYYSKKHQIHFALIGKKNVKCTLKFIQKITSFWFLISLRSKEIPKNYINCKKPFI
ncbi:hypothetical protein SAMN05421789_1013 [Kaistella chaponensis]|uniref:ParE-like toxin of type II ParDE toxin-antitoxin system n=1 Tax=Kaistella chaponensis TaxID=713588 RepID=A0A1N7J2K6_9FLAO|nr:hypothetical protein SAMN05421789_1013 [Kaistella chaponensis]